MFAVQTVIDDEVEKVAEGAETEMTNAGKFKHLFGIYATELWSMPEKDFLEWINSEVMNSSEIPNNSDTIYRQAAIDALESKKDKNAKGDIGGFYNKIIQNDIDELMQLPSVQPEECTETPACDCISRQAAIRIASGYCHLANIAAELSKLPPVQPYTEAEIQKMQELEQAELEKAFKLGKADALKKIRAEIMSKDGLEEALEIIDKYRAESEVGG